jgi:acyl-coenzyme A thioesterase PaaI-like protein
MTLIAALADNAMAYSCAHQMGWASSLVTIGLAVDFVGTAQIGQWLAVDSEVVKAGSTICFAQCLVKADDVVIARANGTFRVVPRAEAEGVP